MNISDFIGILSLCVSCFSIGYALGKDDKTQK